MSISTKIGDRGFTLLLSGERVCKDSLRVEVCGALDEANAFLGLSKSVLKDKRLKELVGSIQKDFFLVGAEVATTPRAAGKLKVRINKRHVDDLQAQIITLERKGALKNKSFHLPGANLSSVSFDIARAVVRRGERSIVTLYKDKGVTNKWILVYLNRLSDLLYLLARFVE